MNEPPDTNRRKVLKTIGVGVVGGTVLTGSAVAHGGDHRVPAWFSDDIWEMAELPPFGDLEDESTVPIWTIAPAAAGKTCAQLEDFPNFAPLLDPDPRFKEGAWNSVDFDHTLSENPFSALWHSHFIFAPDATTPYMPNDLVNEAAGTPLTSGSAIRNANVTEVSIPFGFNCPIRPADEDHKNYCG